MKLQHNVLLKSVVSKKLIILAGLPGSGKSTLGRKLARNLKAEYLSSDEYREELFESSRLDLSGDEVVSKLSKKAYEAMYEDARSLLQDGVMVVVDATHLKPGRKKLVDSMGVPLEEIICLVVKADREDAAAWMKRKKGMANEKETYFEAWKRVMGYFDKHFAAGEYSWPNEEEMGVEVVEVQNGN